MKLPGVIDQRPGAGRLAPGTRVFGKFRLRMMLGVGGMGVVWRAHDEELGFDLALKFLSADLLQDSGALDDLKRETRRGMTMSHPSIVRVYGYHAAEGLAAVAMECVEGNTLAQVRAQSGSAFFEALELSRWLGQLCEALHYAHHEVGLVHRDLKPSNLMVDARGRLKVADFGIAGRPSGFTGARSGAIGVTGLGTLAYASPQQVLGQRACVSHDIYGVGATLYDLLTGKPPFFAGDITAQVKDVVPPSVVARREELWPAPGEPLPPGWEEAIAACLAKDAAKRPASVRELAERLGLHADYAAPRGAESAWREREPKTAPADLPTVRVAAMAMGSKAVAGGEPPVRKAAFGRWTPVALVALVAALIASGWLGWRLIRGQPDVRSPDGVRPAPEVVPAAVAQGRLRLRTVPAAPRVWVDGVELTGAFDEGVSVSSGQRRLRVEKPGYLPAELMVDVPPHDVKDVGPLVLELGVAGLDAVSIPAGLRVEIESETLAAADLEKVTLSAPRPTPVVGVWQRLPWGVYRVKFHDTDGTVKTIPIEVGADRLAGTARAEVTFPRARVEVQGFPEGLRVWVGTRLAGRTGDTPLQLALPPGGLEISVEQPGKAPQVRRLQLVANTITFITPGSESAP